MLAVAATSNAPAGRWAVVDDASYASSTYGFFVIFSADPAAFGISSLEASSLNPQMMIVLEMSCSTLRASSCQASHANTPTGFFLGASGAFSGEGDGNGQGQALSAYSGTSGALSVASGRVSYTLGLTGPCLTLDTACSSSLVAVHLAASAIKLVECPTAVAAGVGMLVQAISVAFSAAGMLSGLG